MQEKRVRLGPRGWAIIIMGCGAAFSSAFVRKTANTEQPSATSQSVGSDTTDDYSNGTAWQSFQRHGGDPASTRAIDARQTAVPAKHSGNLRPVDGSSVPSTHMSQELPAWFKPKSRLDEIIAEGAAPAWQDTGASRSLVQPPAWTNSTSPQNTSRTTSNTSPTNWPSANSAGLDIAGSVAADRASPWKVSPEIGAQSTTSLHRPEPSHAPAFSAGTSARSLANQPTTQPITPAITQPASFGGQGAATGMSNSTNRRTSGIPAVPSAGFRKPNFVYQPRLLGK